MFCRQCGAQNEPSSAFCVNCGAPMLAPSEPFENGPVVTGVPQPASQGVSPTPPVSAPVSQTTAPISTTSRIGHATFEVLREAAWIIWEELVCSYRVISCAWSFVRQRRLRANRERVLQDIGQELSQDPVPESMTALLGECGRHNEEITRCLNDLASQTPRLGWFSRLTRRAQLLRAQSACSTALGKLGEKGISLAPPALQEAVQSMEAAILDEQTRRSRLWEPWRTLTPRRRMEVPLVALLLLTAAIFLPLHFLKKSLDAQQYTNTFPGPRSKDQAETITQQARIDKDKLRRLPQEFAQQRKAASPGQLLVYGNAVLSPGELNEWDDFKVGSPAVLKEGDHYRMWYRGCHFLLSEYACGIGYASSKDGISWKKSHDPVFVPQDPYQREQLNSITVVRAGDSYWMWYSVNPDLFAGQPYATIHLLTSQDGSNWRLAGPALRALSQYTPGLLPNASFDGKLFHLWYADYRSDEDKVMMHMTSDNGTQWKIVGVTSLDTLNGTPNQMSVLTDVVGGYRAFFAYPSFGYGKTGIVGVLASANGTQWHVTKTEMKVLSNEAIQRNNRQQNAISMPAALETSDGLSIWFVSLADNGAGEIRLAFLKEGTS
jgi:hypothetical protein